MVVRCVKSVLLAVVLSIVATVPARAAVFEKTSAFAGNSDQFAAYDFNIGAAGLYLATLSDSLLPRSQGWSLSSRPQVAPPRSSTLSVQAASYLTRLRSAPILPWCLAIPTRDPAEYMQERTELGSMDRPPFPSPESG